MTIWAKTINIKMFLTDDTSPEAVQLAARQIASKLRSNIENTKLWSFDFHDTCQFLEDIADDEEGEDDYLQMFNNGLSMLYDWADANAVWLGVRS